MKPKKRYNTSVKLKQLQWNPLAPTSLQETLWRNMDEMSDLLTEEDLKVLETDFATVEKPKQARK
jgi:hypothetical protein